MVGVVGAGAGAGDGDGLLTGGAGDGEVVVPPEQAPLTIAIRKTVARSTASPGYRGRNRWSLY
jgi:hypothetical protein